MKKIRFFKNKPQDFLIKAIPKLRRLNLYDNDILFSQGDQAEEIYFVISEEFILLMDLAD